jgi:hypothetical protein
MATYIFQKIAKEGERAGLKLGSKESREWFRSKATTVGRVNINAEMQNKARLSTVIGKTDIGRMYHFFYDPKTKETLPYYDKFPLIFVVERYDDGFLGINLHYLPPLYRAQLMDALYSIEITQNAPDAKKLKLSYNILKSASKFKYFKPCVKRYLFSQVRSRYLYIPETEWDIALTLPTERFSKSNKRAVWQDSTKSFKKK